MTRVVAGAARGRGLVVPPGGTRPTSDRAREGLFSTVTAVLGPLTGTRVLDLYAGSGAVGLEALSRGAAHALLVESAAKAARTIRQNARAVGVPGAEVRQERAERVAADAPDAPYDLVFADPPYATTAATLRAVLGDLSDHGWFTPGALVVVERATRDPGWTWPVGVTADRDRRYGDATLWYGRAPMAAPAKSAVP